MARLEKGSGGMLWPLAVQCKAGMVRKMSFDIFSPLNRHVTSFPAMKNSRVREFARYLDL